MWSKIAYVRVILHTIIALLITSKVLLWNGSKASYVRSIRQSLEFLFTDPVLEYPTEIHRVDLFGYVETSQYVADLLSRYQSLNNISTTQFAYGTKLLDGERNCVDNAPPVQWDNCLWTSSSHVACSTILVSNHSQTPVTTEYGVDANLMQYYNQLDSFQLNFDLCNFVNTFASEQECHYWQVKITFRSVALMYLQATISSALIDECGQSSSSSSVSFFELASNWINILTFFFCFIYMGYVIYDLVESVRIYNAVKAAHERAHAAYLNKRVGEFMEHEIASMYSWKDIPRGVKRSFHNYWSSFTLIAVIISIVQASISISNSYNDLENLRSSQKALVGIAIFFLWMSIVQFIPVHSPVYAFAATIQTAFPRIFAFMLSFIPVFLAFVLFGITLFGTELGAFSSVDRAAKFIFAMMAGDSVLQIMQLMTRRSIWASLLFGVSFTLVTAYLLINIFIAIIEEAYFIARKQGRYLELLMWRSLKNMARTKHPKPGTMEDFDADLSTLVLPANPNSQHSSSLLVQLQELDRLSPVKDAQSSMSSSALSPRPSLSPQPPSSQHVVRAQERLRETLAEQHQNRNYQALVQELLEATIPESQLAERQGLQADSLTITLAEETAEMYILGRNHWEYSKMMDYIAEQLDSDGK